MSWSANETECQICHGGFDDPRLLACLHAFCRKCVSSSTMRNERKCPTCGLEIDVSLIATSDASPAGLLLQLFAVTEDTVARQTLGTCPGCRCKPAFMRCSKCSMHFCRSCSKKHVYQDHKVDIDETLRSKLANRLEQCCHVHAERAVSYCFKCRRNLCSPCSGSHGHDRNVVRIATCIDMLMGAVENSISSRIADIFKEMQRMAETKSKLFERISDQLKKIKSRSDRLRELVDKREFALLAEVKETDWKIDECSVTVLNLEKEINEIAQQFSDRRDGVPTFLPYHRIMHVYSRVFQLQLTGDNRRDLSSVKTPSSSSTGIILCVVCKHRVIDPRLLSCFHTACSQCLKDRPVIVCPACQTKIWSDKCKNVSDLPSVLFIQVLADVQAAASDNPKDIKCEHCKKKAVSMYCKTHAQGLCDNCYRPHSASERHETGAVDNELVELLIDRRFNKCSARKRKDSCDPPHDYCFSCKTNVCISCASESSHRGHKLQGLQQLLDDFLHCASPAVAHFKLLLREMKCDFEHAEEKKKRFEKLVEFQRMAIALRCGTIREQIDITEAEMQERLHIENTQTLQSVQSLREQLRAKFSRMKQHLDKVAEIELMANSDDLPYTKVMDLYWQAVKLLHSDSSSCTDSDLLKTLDVELESVAREHQKLLSDLDSELSSADIMSDKSSDAAVGQRQRQEVYRSERSISLSTQSRNEASSTNNVRKFCRRLPVGLLNWGNNCYFNAVMQILSQTPLFWDLLLERTRTMEMPAKCVFIALTMLNTNLPHNIWPDLCLRIAIGECTFDGPLGVLFEIPLSILNESKGVFTLQLYRELHQGQTKKEYMGSVDMNIQRNLLTAAQLNCTCTMRNIVFQDDRYHNLRLDMSVSFSPSTVIQALINFFNETAVLDRYGIHKPSELFNSICARSERFGGQLQQDSHELLRHLMDAVKEEENRFNTDGKTTRSPQDENYPRKNAQLTIVDRVFGGHLLTVFHCHACQMPYHLFEPFLDINLPIVPPNAENEYRSMHAQCNSGHQNDRNVDRFNPSTKHAKTRNAGGRQPTEYETAISALKEPMAVVSIDCLQQGAAFSAETKSFSVVQSLIHFTKEEQLHEHLCLNCNKNNAETKYTLTPGTKQSIIYNPPAVLTVHIRRFMQNENGSYRKYEELVLFEETLDLAPFCSQHSKRQQSDKKIMYRLYGVIIHIGNLQSGHYTACVKMREIGDSKRAMKFLQAELLDKQSLLDKKKFIELLGNPSKYLKGEPDPEVDSNGQWFLISDTRIDPISFEGVRRQQAYMLFYERVH